MDVARGPRSRLGTRPGRTARSVGSQHDDQFNTRQNGSSVLSYGKTYCAEYAINHRFNWRGYGMELVRRPRWVVHAENQATGTRGHAKTMSRRRQPWL